MYFIKAENVLEPNIAPHIIYKSAKCAKRPHTPVAFAGKKFRAGVQDYGGSRDAGTFSKIFKNIS